MNGHLYFEIQADDTGRARQFYTDVFGWRITEQENFPTEYWRIDTGGTRGGLLKRPAKTPPRQHGTNAFVCSLEVESFDETAAKVVGSGGQVALPKFAVSGTCWQGYFLDPEGNTFGLFQVDETAE